MNDETGKGDMTPERIEQLRERLNTYRAERELPWSELAPLVGLKAGTVSPWAGKTYQGDNARIALAVHKFFVSEEAAAAAEVDAPEAPAFVPTPTSLKIGNVLRYAKRGRMCAFTGSPGVGKTKAIHRFRQQNPNVWVATLSPSSAGVPTMLIQVLKALGEPDATGTPQALSGRVLARVRGTSGLIVIDECQHASEKAMEEIRSWHDSTGIGIALVGNEQVIQRLEGGSRKVAFAQLYSRVSMRDRVAQSTPEDNDMLAGAWGIADQSRLGFLRTVTRLPGGLRNLTFTVELAWLLAIGGGATEPTVADLKDAWAQLSSRPIAA